MPRLQNQRRRAQRIPFLAALAFAFCFLPGGLFARLYPSARAASTFTVNSTADGADANTSDGLCDDGAGHCTLRAAIEQANANAGADTINFQIGSGVQTITPATDLPIISDPVVIDGTTQPGFAGTPIVELNGNNRSNTNRALLFISAGDSTVRGLVINRSSNAPIAITTKGNNHIEGNFIGTNVAGNARLPNSFGLIVNTPNNTIGGTSPAARNVIAGNSGNGIEFNVSDVAGNVIQGNFIGTNAAGTAALFNGGSGIRGALNNSTIGGTAPGARNVISGNSDSGIQVFASNVIQGNFIGTDATGTQAIPNGAPGIRISVGSNNQIGGATPEARNVISGNNEAGISLEDGAHDNVVRGNFIGTDVTGTKPLPNSRVIGNSSSGIWIKNASNNRVGGTGAGEGNLIAFNGVSGVLLVNTASGLNTPGNTVRGNSIFSNDGLGIDIVPFGVTPNDQGDADIGPNGLQNSPTITALSSDSNSTTLRGAFNSTPNTTFTLDFYTGRGCDPSGSGEGTQFFGTATAVSDAGGDAAFLVTLPSPLPPGRFITATATDPAGSTSEFSQCSGSPSGVAQFTDAAPRVREDVGTFNLPVVRAGGSSSSLTVNFSTTGETATPGQDFTPASGTLTFAPGETVKNIPVQIINDSIADSSETFRVTLSNPDAPDAVGSPAEAVVRIFDTNSATVLSFGGVSVKEGDAGTTNAVIPVTLTLATGQTVTVNFSTLGITAVAGTDFQPTSGSLTFPPGTTSRTVNVPVIGDTLDENDKSFTLSLTNAVNAAISVSSNPPQTIIVDDDPSPVISIGDVSVVEGTSGTTNAVFPVTLSAPTEKIVGINFATADGTANANSDYQPTSGSLFISPGSTSATITVAVNGDTVDEPIENFFVNLSNPSGALLPDARAVGTIGTANSPTLQFSQAIYSAAESDHAFTVTVTRAGDSSGAASVTYATADGTASERGDYTTSLGTLRFAANETSKTFQLLLTEDAFQEQGETVRLTLADVEGALLGAQSSAELSVQNSNPPAPGNPIDDAQTFVREHYHDFLNREADTDGLNFWTGNITQCGSNANCIEARRINVSAAFFLSIEFQSTGYQVIRFYKASFGTGSAARPRGLPRYREFLRDTQDIGRGVIVGQGPWEQQLRDNTLDFARRWVVSAEFVAQFPANMTAAQFVDKLFANSQVAPTQPERDAALAAFASGGTNGRADALLNVTNSGSVYNKQYNPALVLMQYIGYLRRSPDDAPDADFNGFDFWLTKLNSFSNPGEDVRNESAAFNRVLRAEMIRAFLSSIEYRRRFAP